MPSLDLILISESLTLPGLFTQRAKRTPDHTAYMQYREKMRQWKGYTWQEMFQEMLGWQHGLLRVGLKKGDRIAIFYKNSVEWVLAEQASLSLGLVVVPLYPWDNAENIAHILADSGCRLLFTGNMAQWQILAVHRDHFPELMYLVLMEETDGLDDDAYIRVVKTTDWPSLSHTHPAQPAGLKISADDLATIIYTSGTTGPPKGVMLSHHNVLWNAQAVVKVIPGYLEDLFLSFLPLSHSFERTVGYYIPMMSGSTIAYARSVKDLAEDMLTLRPTILIAVPRIFEKIYGKIQTRMAEKKGLQAILLNWTIRVGRLRFAALQNKKQPSIWQQLAWVPLNRLVAGKILKKLGGRLRLTVSGGAPLHEKVSNFFLALGLPLVQGYGLTEAAPVVSTNSLDDNVPESVGRPLQGVEIQISKDDELFVRSPAVMSGYWGIPSEKEKVLGTDGWLHTGDIVTIKEKRIYIKGRLKDILVTSTGEKISPTDLEMSVLQDPLFHQMMIVGEGKPFITGLIVLNKEIWPSFAKDLSLDPDDPSSLVSVSLQDEVLKRIETLTSDFPSYASIRKIFLTLEPWTIENGLVTPTMKLKRFEIENYLNREINKMYANHIIV